MQPQDYIYNDIDCGHMYAFNSWGIINVQFDELYQICLVN